MSNQIMERMRDAFRAEAFELLSELDTSLLALETNPDASEQVNRVFRAIHTIKGSGATAGFNRLASVAHKVEEAFELARSGQLPVTGELVDCGLKACDVFRSILEAGDPETEPSGERSVLDAVALLVPAADGHCDRNSGHEEAACPRQAFDIIIRPAREFFYSGSDPMTLLDELRELGPAHVVAHVEHVPPLFDLDAESCYLWWNVKLVTDRGESRVRDVFAFVESECEAVIRLLDDQSSSIAVLGSISSEALDLFAIECQEHLEALERHALELERDESARDNLDAMFRAVHSLKGNVGVLLGQVSPTALPTTHPLPLLSRIAHAVESVLDDHRRNQGTRVLSDSIALVLETRDVLQSAVEAIGSQSAACVVPSHIVQRLGIEEPRPSADAGASAFRNTATQCLDIVENCLASLTDEPTNRSLLKTYHRGLKTLASAANYQERSDLVDPIARQLRVLDEAMRTGQALTADDREHLRNGFEATRCLIQGSPAPSSPQADDARPASSTPKAPAASGTVRIDQEKLDRLMRVVGELLVAKGAFPSLAERLSRGEDRAAVARAIKEAGAGISHIADELQDSVMSIRMLPVKTVFQRFPRLVRDLARGLGKDVQLLVEGDTIELDKTILEQIGDPLVHLVRNAIDHGLEPAAERLNNGKSPAGHLRLRARSDSGSVVIEVEDDGRGLNAEVLKRKAIERGFLTDEAAAAMSPSETWRLVFLPGLSTAEKVTDVSGRGVGMDVVQNNIRSLHGAIDIRSAPGQGTTFSIKLPTSLIISKGILLEAGGQEYILPLTSIRDMVKVPADKVHNYQGLSITQVRGEVYSIFSISDMFGLPSLRAEELPIAVIDTGKVRYGLIADRFISEVEVLVKPLTGGLEHCSEFHGAAIMGDGRVVLVLNPLECHRLDRVNAQ